MMIVLYSLVLYSILLARVEAHIHLNDKYAVCTYYQPQTKTTQNPFIFLSMLERFGKDKRDRDMMFPGSDVNVSSISTFVFVYNDHIHNQDLAVINKTFDIHIIEISRRDDKPPEDHVILNVLGNLWRVYMYDMFDSVLFLRPNSLVAASPFPHPKVTYSNNDVITFCSTSRFGRACDMSAFFLPNQKSVILVSMVSSKLSMKLTGDTDLSTISANFDEALRSSGVNVQDLVEYYPGSENPPRSHADRIFHSSSAVRVVTFPYEDVLLDIVPRKYVYSTRNISVCNTHHTPYTPCGKANADCIVLVNLSTVSAALRMLLPDIHKSCQEICRCPTLRPSFVFYHPDDFQGGALVSPAYKSFLPVAITEDQGSCNLFWAQSPDNIPPDVVASLLGERDQQIDHYSLWGRMECPDVFKEGDEIVLHIQVNEVEVVATHTTNAGSLYIYSQFHLLLLNNVPMGEIYLTVVSPPAADFTPLLAAFRSFVHFQPRDIANINAVKSVGGKYGLFFIVDMEDNKESDLVEINVSYGYSAMVPRSMARAAFHPKGHRPNILVTGYPHSGTSITQKILSNHPEAVYVSLESMPFPFFTDLEMNSPHVFKYPYLYNAAPPRVIAQHQDDWRVIVVLKDFRDAVTSIWNKVKIDDLDSFYDEWELYWEHLVINTLSLLKYSHVIVIRYEDLFDAPEYTTFRRVFEFAGLSFDPVYVADNYKFPISTMQSATSDGTAIVGDDIEVRRLQQMNSNFTQYSGKWKSHPHADYLRRRIENNKVLKQFMVMMGYEV